CFLSSGGVIWCMVISLMSIDVSLVYLLIVFFFFQAEDGIRDDLVTGVQTCALPILTDLRSVDGEAVKFLEKWETDSIKLKNCGRSEERRVGKECRSRWSRYD